MSPALLLASVVLVSSTVAAETETPDCFDAIVLARVVRQRFAEVPYNVSRDTIFGPTPGVLDIEVRRVIRGRVHGDTLRVHSTVSEYFRRDRWFTWGLRRNALGEFNLVFPADAGRLRRCARDAPPARPYVPLGTPLVD